MINKILSWKYYNNKKDTIILSQIFSEEYTKKDKILYLLESLWYVIIDGECNLNEIVIESKKELDELKWFVGEMSDENLLYS